MSEAAKKRILIVDDDVDFVESNKELLEASGYEVLAAYDGSSGVRMARERKPDLMVLDVMMATKSEGFDVSRQLEQMPEMAGMPILMVTGIKKAMNLPFGFEPDSTWLPVDQVLEKPVRPEEFLGRIRELLAGTKG